MSDLLRELYQEIIMDHSRSPRCFGRPASYTHSKDSYNPLCGDKVALYCSQSEQGFLQLSFEGSGCAMCMASTSLLLEAFNNRSIANSEVLIKQLFKLLSTEALSLSEQDVLGKLMVLQSVKQYPSRVKCVTLSWHALKEILEMITGKSHR